MLIEFVLDTSSKIITLKTNSLIELQLATLTLIADLNFDPLGNELKLQRIGHKFVFWKNLFL